MDSGLLEKSVDVSVEKPRAIIDRRALLARLEAIFADDLAEREKRAQVLAAAKGALDDGRAEVLRRFEAGAHGSATVKANCYLADQLIRVLYDYVTGKLYPLANPSEGERLALVALGGYGRGELAPFSDIDLLFLLPYKMTPRSEQVVEELLYFLWDLGLKVGQAVRSVDECVRLAKSDMVIRTSLLEARWLWGEQALYEELRQRYRREVEGRAPVRFIESKLAERDARHKRLGGSRYALEPNIKEGKGGLRDLHTLFWIAKNLYHVDDIGRMVERGLFTRAEAQRFIKAQNFLWTLRCHLHYLAGRAEERLTFDVQKAIAPRMGFTDHAGLSDVERFMKRYFLVAKDVGSLTRIFCAALEMEHGRGARFRIKAQGLIGRRRRVGGFPVEGDRITVKGPEDFKAEPVKLLRLFQVAQTHDLDVHPKALRWVTQNLKLIDRKLRDDPLANRTFLQMLTSEKDPETTLRRLNEAGVFGRFVPDFGRVVAQMQYNMYHHFTVDEHTIMAIGILHAIEKGRLAEEAPIASEVVHKALSRRALYVAVLLHDIAKGRNGDHSELGAEVAETLCPRLGLSEEETETVAWLVRYHLSMSNVAFKRDLDDPKTIEDFARLVQSIERLRLLLVLTVADIRAVGPGTWNAWKAALLRDLYWRTEEVLTGGVTGAGRKARIDAAKQALAAALPDWPKKDIDAHLRRGYAPYWLSCDSDTHARHARLVRAAEVEKRPLVVDWRIDRYREVTEVTIYTADHPGLFSRIAGAMAVAGASIDAARIFTLSNGKALDTFWIRSVQGGPFDRSDQLARLASAIEKALDGRLKVSQELAAKRSSIPSRLRVFKVPPRVLIDNRASRRHTVIEVNGRDRPGLLHKVTWALTRLNLIIHSARVSTFGERVVDTFYVNGPLGDKIEDERRLLTIRKKLLAALEDPDCAPEKPKAKPKPAVGKPRKEAAKARDAAGGRKSGTSAARSAEDAAAD